MSDVAEDAMDSSAVSEEDVDESAPCRSSSKISDVGEILEGKRAKKTVERLDFQAPKPKEKIKIGDGGGDKLGDIPRTNYQINKRKAEELKLLHSILYDRPGKSASVKKNLRLFNGFAFAADSPDFTKKRDKLVRNSSLTNAKLKLICSVLDLEKKGTHLDLIDRILNFLVAPKNSGKRAPVKKRRRSKKKLSADDATSRKSRPKPKSSSSGAKRSKPGSKSKAIVMDSSTDDEEEEEEKTGASVEAEGSDGEEKPSEPEEEESDESSKPKSSRERKKKQRTPAKKRARSPSSDGSDGASEAEEKPKRKKAAAAKSKKADSSSSNKNNHSNAVEDSSDEDEPLIRMVKKAPTDEQLRKTVENLLKEANLEEMTMKQICQKVFDTYPEHDLSSRKDFIKQTVKTLIT